MASEDYLAVKAPDLAGPDSYHVYLGHCDTPHRDVIRRYLTQRGFSCYDSNQELAECETGMNSSRNVLLFLTPASSTRQGEETPLEKVERRLALEKVGSRGQRSVTLVLCGVDSGSIPRRLFGLTAYSTDTDSYLEGLQLELKKGQSPCQ